VRLSISTLVASLFWILTAGAVGLTAAAWGAEAGPDPAAQVSRPVFESAAPGFAPEAPAQPAGATAAATAAPPATAAPVSAAPAAPAQAPVQASEAPVAAVPPAPVPAAPVPVVRVGDPAEMQPPPGPPPTDLWERIRRGFAMPDLQNKKAANSTHWYAGQPDYFARMSGRASLYLYYIVQQIEKRGLPTELALLPFVESAMQPQAVSSAQAAGLWQFVPSTGRIYSLEQNAWKDERFGVVESTRAALDYLEKLYAEFGSWQLALAAYNYGEAGVEKALAYNRTRHKPLNYENLRLPRETQYYVPKLQAIKNIVSDPQHYGIELPAIRDEPYFVTISGSRDMDLSTAAQLADMPLEDFQALNPAFNRPLIVGALAPTILLPADRGEKFAANLAAWQATGQPLASWTAYRLKSGESLRLVAERAGVTEASLRAANHVPPRYVAAAGSTILIPRDEGMGEDVSGEMLDGSLALVPEKAGLRKITVRVRRGDSLASIARRWHVGQDEIIAWNNLRSTDLFAGQRLSLTVASASSSHRKAAPHSAAPADSANTITISAARADSPNTITISASRPEHPGAATNESTAVANAVRGAH
jgi:membrane-bound lytic murein transglycosylase D